MSLDGLTGFPYAQNMQPNMVCRVTGILSKISSIIIQKQGEEELIQKILDVLHSDMGLLRGTFTVRHGNALVIDASEGLNPSAKNRGRYRMGEGITGEVAATGESVIVPDITKDSRFLDKTLSRRDAVLSDEQIAFLCVPVFRQEIVIGTLSGDRIVDKDVDLNVDLQILQIVGNIVGEMLASRIETRMENEALREEIEKLKSLLEVAPVNIIGNSRGILQVYNQVQQVAPSAATVLIRGASGTGKELVARSIVDASPRKDNTLIIVNCAALPDNLIESELFGHEKGAFTGAIARRIGRAEEADGGTLFLDEIGDLSLPVQVKLLRFLQEKTFSRVGSNKELSSDVRIIAATSRNLEELMKEGKFREDLYYRLNIFPIVVPSLANRKSDILLLGQHFLEKYSGLYNKAIVRFSSKAINLLTAYSWPGNVRELENSIEHAVLTATDDTIHAHNLPATLQIASENSSDSIQITSSFKNMVDSFARNILLKAMTESNGNMAAAARSIGLSNRMMHYNLIRHNLK